MVTRALTPKVIKNLGELTCDQILVLSSMASGMEFESIGEKWCMPTEKVARIAVQIREKLGKDAAAIYREYGRSLNFKEKSPKPRKQKTGLTGGGFRTHYAGSPRKLRRARHASV